jgi:hypothetical protein
MSRYSTWQRAGTVNDEVSLSLRAILLSPFSFPRRNRPTNSPALHPVGNYDSRASSAMPCGHDARRGV